ncbi:MAG: DNA-formamidopyrimidine glycosylase, partial [Proteobacteria bacterium]|nr:DNA-formamidopyrimidine glycosylase [Pseudomonadota bacterium]
MPELPEVETTRRGIADRIRGLMVESVEVRQFRLRLPVPEDFSARLEGSILGDTLRRAKYLLVESSSGRLLIHLGMSGSLRIADPTQELRKHDHVIWNLEGD